MSGIKDQQNMDALRKRLYERGFTDDQLPIERHQLSSTETDVSRGWASSTPVQASTPAPAPDPVFTPDSAPAPAHLEVVPEVVENVFPDDFMPQKKKHSYRFIIILASIGLFIVTAAISSTYLFFGANQISAKNITITMNAPFAIAAGEELPLQVSVANQNSVQVESATLILNYPAGTKSSDQGARDLYEERIPIEKLAAGEAMNIPVAVLLYGEENEEKEIKASIEYRVAGSNGTFFKDADPVKIKINSSPLVVRVESVEKVSSGQEIEMRVTVQSNTASVQRNILVSASYPNSFSFVKSDPTPSYGENEWLIGEIQPESSKVITLRGKINGVANEEAEIQFVAGTPRSDNQFIMGSILTKAKTNYVIERPFLDVAVKVNGADGSTVVVEPGVVSRVTVQVKNTLDEAIYDMRVEVTPKGNLIRDDRLKSQNGFYDSSSKSIRWEVAGVSSLAEVLPGETRDFTFTVEPDINQTTGSFTVSTNIFARRVSEASVAEEVMGTSLSEVKYSSELEVGAQAGYSDGPFTDTGSIPPVVGKETTYTLTFVAEAGANDATGAILTATLPPYISWKNVTEGPGAVEFNPVSQQIRWNIGTMEAKSRKQLRVQVGLLPSTSQVDRNLVLVGSQELRATDRFTGVSLKAISGNVNNELSTEAGFEKDNGRVQAE